MKLSTKGRYGVRAMYDLALMYGQSPQSVKCIAERLGIPEAYLEQLIAPLRKAEDAVELDTTELDFAQSEQALLEIIQKRIQA